MKTIYEIRYRKANEGKTQSDYYDNIVNAKKRMKNFANLIGKDNLQFKSETQVVGFNGKQGNQGNQVFMELIPHPVFETIGIIYVLCRTETNLITNETKEVSAVEMEDIESAIDFANWTINFETQILNDSNSSYEVNRNNKTHMVVKTKDKVIHFTIKEVRQEK